MLTYFTLNLIISDGHRLVAGVEHCKEGWHLPCRGRIGPSQCRPVKDCLCFWVHTMTVRAHSWPLCFIKQAVTHTTRHHCHLCSQEDEGRMSAPNWCWSAVQRRVWRACTVLPCSCAVPVSDLTLITVRKLSQGLHSMWRDGWHRLMLVNTHSGGWSKTSLDWRTSFALCCVVFLFSGFLKIWNSSMLAKKMQKHWTNSSYY